MKGKERVIRFSSRCTIVAIIIIVEVMLMYHSIDVPSDNTKLGPVGKSEFIRNNAEFHVKGQSETLESMNRNEARIEKSKLRNELLPRVLVIVFPQFHRDSINDELWGEGFTDWDTLRRAPQKNRLGYDIPRPTELGYYDLTDVEPRKKQGQLAQEYGIDGFVYHHYWFYDDAHPGPNLHAPLIKMLQDGHPNVPFCLHWCNSKWTKTWNAVSNKTLPDVLQNQYFPDNDANITAHYNWLRQFFHHPNYIKVRGQPVFMLYNKKPGSFTLLQKLRSLAMKDGFPGLYMTVGMSKSHDDLFPEGQGQGQWRLQYVRRDIFEKSVAYPNPYSWTSQKTLSVPNWCQEGRLDHKRGMEISGILTSFDNTPRREAEEAVLWSAADPDVAAGRFHESLRSAIYYESCCFQEEKALDDDRFVLVNSMNEWAEGMALEPSDVFGRRLLEVVRDAKNEVLESKCNWSAFSQHEKVI